jgi:hypothetical protein
LPRTGTGIVLDCAKKGPPAPALNDTTVIEEVGSIFPLLLAVGALLILGGIFRRGRPLLAAIGLSIALTLLLLCVEHFAKIGLSYDLAARTSIRLYVPEAPVTPLLGLIYLALVAAILVCGTLAVVFSRAFWIKTSSRRSMLLLAFIPTLLLYVHQLSQAEDIRRREEVQGYEEARRAHLYQANACLRYPPATAEGCRRFVADLAQESDDKVTARGRRWAWNHHAETDRACQSSSDDFDPRPAFAAGCKAAVADLHRVQGERWAYEHQLEHEDGCKPGAQGPEDQPGFLEGCAQAVRSRLRTMGENWAASQLIFNVADCRPGLPGAKDNPDFLNGCQYHVSHASFSSLSRDGINFARDRHIRYVAQCSTSVANAPPEFVKACEKEVRLPRQEEGKRWAQLKQIANEEDCNQPEWQAREPEAKADLVQACRDEVIEQRVIEGRLWAWKNGTSVEDCRSDMGGVKHNPQFVEGCEEIIRHRLKSGP